MEYSHPDLEVYIINPKYNFSSSHQFTDIMDGTRLPINQGKGAGFHRDHRLDGRHYKIWLPNE